MTTLSRILLVEDDPDIQEIAALALESLGGFEVTVCGSGAEALEEAARRPPDLVLLDFMMPGMDGAEVLAELRRRPDLPNAPVVFMTAKAQAREIERFLALGAADVITKPFDPVELPERLNAIWNRIHAG